MHLEIPVYYAFQKKVLFLSFTACVPFPLYFPLAKNQTGLPFRQQRVGVSEVCMFYKCVFQIVTVSSIHIAFLLFSQIWTLAVLSLSL